MIPPTAASLWDLLHGKEREQNTNYMLAERLQQFGLRAGDKVAFIGIGTNADWARLDHVRLIGEIPVVWQRHQRLLDNYLIEDPDQIRTFWNADSATQQRVLDAFRNAGAVMVVTDGLYNNKFPTQWHRVLRADQIGKPRREDDVDYRMRLNYRFLWLVPRLDTERPAQGSEGKTPTDPAGGKSL